MKETLNFLNKIKSRTSSLSPLNWTELDENFKFGNSWTNGTSYKTNMIVWWNDYYDSTGAINNSDGQMSLWLCKSDHIADPLSIPGNDPRWERLTVGDLPNLNGTNYLMVYGTGTPEENGVELLAAYEAAKRMPRYLGLLDDNIRTTLYKGQTYRALYDEGYYKMLVDYTGYPPTETGEYSLSVREAEAKSPRTTLIVAPGEYNFGATAFRVNSSGINIVSLTGNSDVIISSTEVNSEYDYIYGIKVTANDILIKGINCRTNTFYIANSLDNLICEHCIGGNYSFGGGYGDASGTFNDCTGGNYSFGSGGIASGTFNYCTGGYESFGGYGGTASGTFDDCKGSDGSFGGGGIASGTFNNCTGGDYSFGSVGIASGTFNYCTGGYESFGGGGIASGTFNNCTGGYYSFGGDGGTASGTFDDCTGGNYSFGSYGTASGTFNNCIGGNYSFGSYGTASGTFNHCTGGDGSFGGYGGTIRESARLYYTRLTLGTFPTPVTGGRLILCIDGNNNIETI